MSRAVSTVVTCPTISPEFCSQASKKSSSPPTTAATSASVSGAGSAARNSSIPSSDRQSTGAEEPVPRGSKPTMS